MEQQYIFSKKIFFPALIIILLLFGWCISVEGWSIFKQKVVVKCGGENVLPTGDKCEMEFKNGTKFSIPLNGEYVYNDHNQKNIDILNYGSLFVLIISQLLNWYIYNRKYSFKEKFKEIKEKVDIDG